MEGMYVLRAPYLDLTGQPVRCGRQRDGRRWIAEPADISSSLRYWRDGLLTPHAWLRALAAIEEAAWMGTDDPLPAAAIGVRIIARDARRLPRFERPSPRWRSARSCPSR
jgi:hypothetical protein